MLMVRPAHPSYWSHGPCEMGTCGFDHPLKNHHERSQPWKTWVRPLWNGGFITTECSLQTNGMGILLITDFPVQYLCNLDVLKQTHFTGWILHFACGSSMIFSIPDIFSSGGGKNLGFSWLKLDGIMKHYAVRKVNDWKDLWSDCASWWRFVASGHLRSWSNRKNSDDFHSKPPIYFT